MQRKILKHVLNILKKILIIDDDLHIGNVLEETLTNEGYGVIRAYSGTEAVLLLSQVKPDLVAPGVEIMSCAPGGGYQVRTGTSMATPFVTGSAALLMQWGIVNGNDAYLYGEKMKAYLIRGARKLPGFTAYPNPVLGWGALCTANSIPR